MAQAGEFLTEEALAAVDTGPPAATMASVTITLPRPARDAKQLLRDLLHPAEAATLDPPLLSRACQQAAYRRRKGIACAQRQRRLDAMAADPRPIMTSLEGCTVERIEEAEARPIILRYEWLGTLGMPTVCTGLRDPQGTLIGVALFGHPGSPEAGNLCGPDVSTLCLIRGACVHWAHPHAASFLISRAVKLSGAEVVYAYADPAAGELGTVYQACGWLYLGQNIGRKGSGVRYEQIRDPSGAIYSTRALRHRGLTITEAKAMGWQPIKVLPKHKYMTFVGDKRRRRQQRALLRFEPLAYPKR